MCVSPLKILNRANHWDENKPLYLYVPCGRCEECRQNNRNDWFVRCFYEWSSNNENGFSFFYTLTYNNDNLPTFQNKPCFSRRHIQLFIKRLRHVLSKSETPLRYMVTCEYGILHGRPHYHVIFFVGKWVNPFIFYKMVENAWQYGFVKAGEHAGVIQNYTAIQYVTKYVTKDFSHTEEFLGFLLPSYINRVNRLISNLNYKYDSRIDIQFKYDPNTYVISFQLLRKNALSYSPDELLEHQRILKYVNRFIKSVTPFHLQSSGLGLGMMENKYVSFEHEYALVMKSDMSVTKFRLPRYLKRKMWYDCIENEVDGKRNRFILNQRGKEHLLSKLPEQVAERKLSLMSAMLSSNVKIVNKEMLDVVNSALDKFKFHSVDALAHYISHIDVDLDILSIYSLVFRDRCNFISDLTLTDEYVKNHYIELADYHLSSVSLYDFGKVYQLYSLETEHLKHSTFNYHPYFRMYEEVLTVLQAYSFALRISCDIAKTNDDIQTRKIRQLFLDLKL